MLLFWTKPRRRRNQSHIPREISSTYLDEISSTYLDEISSTYDDENNSTYDDEISRTYDDEISSTYDDEISSTYDDENNSTYDDEISRTYDDEISSTYDDEISSTYDNEISSTYDDEISSTYDGEISRGFHEPIQFNNLGVQRGYKSSDYSATPATNQQLEEPASKKDMAEYMEIKVEGFSDDCKLHIKMKKSELNQQERHTEENTRRLLAENCILRSQIRELQLRLNSVERRENCGVRNNVSSNAQRRSSVVRPVPPL